MKIGKLNSTRLHWRMDGDESGKKVVFANSLGTDLRVWDEMIEHLPKQLCLIRFDKRGHGLSDCPDAPYHMNALIEDTEDLLDLLGAKDVVLVGLSIGGMIAQGLAAKRPDLIKALVLSNTAAKMGDAQMWHQRIAMVRDGHINEIADQILERWFSERFRQQRKYALWRNMLIRTPQEGYLGCCAAIADADLTHLLGSIRQPTLGICGSEDGASPPDLMSGTLSQISGSRFEVIKGVGHLPCVEAPETFAEILTRFFEEVEHV